MRESLATEWEAIEGKVSKCIFQSFRDIIDPSFIKYLLSDLGLMVTPCLSGGAKTCRRDSSFSRLSKPEQRLKIAMQEAEAFDHIVTMI